MGSEMCIRDRFMNRKLDSKKRISKWQWCAWLLFSIILFFLNQMKVSIFYTVFYGIIVHFLITCIWRILTAGFAEQNGRNAKLNGRITFDY